MAKRTNRAKRSLSRLPKGLPARQPSNEAANPFDIAKKQKRAKFQVHNRSTTSYSLAKAKPSALAQTLDRRKHAIKESLVAAGKANVFDDKRIGEYNRHMTADEQNLARLVKERSMRSKRVAKYSLDDDHDSGPEERVESILTHKGKRLDQLSAKDHVLLSDDEDEDGDLDAVDTALHFGGRSGGQTDLDAYGPASGRSDLGQVYASRKMELDDLIKRRKMMKAEKLKSKETQNETFEKLDESFSELAAMLSFRDKDKEIRQHVEAKRAGTLPPDDQEMADWDREMKQYMYADRRVQATDRTKTQEEIAKEEAERLHELETRRLARMNGDFEGDDFSDIATDDEEATPQRKKSKITRGADDLRQSEDEGSAQDEIETRFTADGLVRVDKSGKILGKFIEDLPAEKDVELPQVTSEVGTRVSASYRATEQFDGNESWFTGVVSGVKTSPEGAVLYDIEYDDGDFEEDVEPRHVKPMALSEKELEKEDSKKKEEAALKRKRQVAREKARGEIPFVFEIPTTLDSLHEMIATYAKTGADASVIIRRIHTSNSVRFNRRNAEKMQNYYDVLIRRFIAVGDAIYESGNGGNELDRYKQLDDLTDVLYVMAQDSAEIAAAVWSRRLGFLQNAHAKRMRDALFERADGGENTYSTWPSTGTFLLLRALGHIFPVTDQRHPIVTPTTILLGQIIVQSPILSRYDLVVGILCVGLLIEYTKEAKRFVPEAFSFLASVVRLFADESQDRSASLPTFQLAAELEWCAALRHDVSARCETEMMCLSLEKDRVLENSSSYAILMAVLHLIETSTNALSGSLGSSEKEAIYEISESILALNPKSKVSPLPKDVQKRVAVVASVLSHTCGAKQCRPPINRRSGSSLRDQAIKSLAPRLEDPEKYSMSKDKGKSGLQAAADRIRREYKREHKAVSREIRLDAQIIEENRRAEKEKKDSAARAKRQKAFAWLESEQAAMNQQVRLGGGLLKGGGFGAAKAKAATARLGIKKGGKF